MDIERLRRVRTLAAAIGEDAAALGRVRQLGALIGELAELMLEGHDTLTCAQACERLGLKPGAIRQLVRRKRIVARHEGRELRITRESVEAFAADRRPRKKSGK